MRGLLPEGSRQAVQIRLETYNLFNHANMFVHTDADATCPSPKPVRRRSRCGDLSGSGGVMSGMAGSQTGPVAFARARACRARGATREADEVTSGCASFMAMVQSADVRERDRAGAGKAFGRSLQLDPNQPKVRDIVKTLGASR